MSKSFINCDECKIGRYEPIVCNTNSSDNLEKVDIMFIFKCVTLNDRLWLKGDFTKIFKEDFLQFMDKNDLKYFISSLILCPVTYKDDVDELARYCVPNLDKFLKITKPKLVVFIADDIPKSLSLNNLDTNITKISKILDLYERHIQEKDYEFLYNKIEELFNIKKTKIEEKMKGIDLNILDEPDIKSEPIKEIKKKDDGVFEIGIDLSIEDSLKEMNIDPIVYNDNDQKLEISKNDKDIHMYKVPQKYMDLKYRIEDVQYEPYRKYLLLMFRDDKNKKCCHKMVLPDNNFYWYNSTRSDIWVQDINKLEFKIGPYKERNIEENAFEGDFKMADKFMADYYLQKEKECEIIKRNIFYFDIEIFSDGLRIFPDPKKAEKPINAISFKMDNDETQLYLLSIPEKIDPNINKIIKKYKNVTLFTDEKMLIKMFIKKIHLLEPTFLTGWNTDTFDIPYIYNRMKKLGMNANDLSPYGFVQIDYGIPIIFGYVCLDLLWLYKALTYTNEPSYKLGVIAAKVLDGFTKIEHEESLDDLYKNDIEKLIKYSFRDTDILEKMNETLNHIDQQDELRRVTTVSQRTAMSTIGQADGLFYSHLKKNGQTFINSKHEEKEKIPGAYVRSPVGGRYDWVVDFDYTSLYPSITNSFNIGPNTYIAKFVGSYITDDDLHIEQNAYNYLYDKESLKDNKIKIIFNPITNNKIEEVTVEELDKYFQKHDAIVSTTGTVFKGHKKEFSIFYDIINKLFNQRKFYKNEMKKCEHGSTIYKLFNSKQMAYKILLNSLYGILANEHFRFYNLDLAATITGVGRESIKFGGEHINSYMMTGEFVVNKTFIKDVLNQKDYLLYCDTDSLFLWMEKYLENKNIKVTLENISKITTELQKIINENILDKFCEIHNIEKQYSMLEMKNELICERYFTLDVKKKYALKVVENEGKKIDKIEIKGLETERSDIPIFSKEMLKILINKIMKDDELDIDNLNDIVEKYKLMTYDLIEKRELSIFKSVSFSKDPSEYKNLPQHIKGMYMFNDLEYDYFRTGHKGILVPTLGLDLSKAPKQISDNYNNIFSKKWTINDLNCIVLPDTYDKVPEYYQLDKNKIINFSIKDRAELIMNPLANKQDSLLTW